MNATVIVVTKMTESKVSATYLNIEGNEIEPTKIILNGPPWVSLDPDYIPEKVQTTKVTIIRNEE